MIDYDEELDEWCKQNPDVDCDNFEPPRPAPPAPSPKPEPEDTIARLTWENTGPS